MTSLAVVHAVVLTWRDRARASAAVGRLLAQPRIAKVWLVENESDGTAWPTADDRLAFLPQKRNLGFSAGVNVGLACAMDAGADAVLVQNDDAELLGRSVDTLVSELAAGNALGMVAPRVVDMSGRAQALGGAFSRWTMQTDALRDDRLDYLTWACVLVRAQALRDVGMLSDRFFMYWEDVEFGIRLTDAGWGMRVVDSATLVHEGGASHARAGAAVMEYSTFGVVVLARTLDGVAPKVGALLRVLRRLGGALLLRDGGRFVAVARGAWMGIRATAPATAWYPRKARRGEESGRRGPN